MLSSLSFIEFYIYVLQQKLYGLLSIELAHIELLVIFIFFVGGCLTSFNPCFLSIFPIIISYISANNLKSLKRLFLILGFVSSLFFVLSIFFFFGYSYRSIIFSIPILSSIFIIFISLSLLEIIYLNDSFITNIRKLLGLNFRFFIEAEAYILGLFLGLSSFSCSTPILLTLLFWLSYKSSFVQALIYLLFYILGYILPLGILINITLYTDQIKIISLLWQYLIPFGGSILLSLGIFSFLEQIFV